MPNYQGVWSLSTQYQNAAAWQAANRVPLSGNIGLIMAGTGGSHANYIGIESIIITSTGNASDYGELDIARDGGCAFGSSTRYVQGGNSSDPTTTCYGNFTNFGTAVEFGELTVRLYGACTGASNNTRGIIAGGNNASGHSSQMDYCTISTVGNFTSFGTLTQARATLAGLANTTRAVFGGGDPAGTSTSNKIDYSTIASTGSMSDFGDLNQSKQLRGAASSSTRGLFMGGYTNSDPYNLNVIDYITIGSTGNATDFGDLTVARRIGQGLSNAVRAVAIGGNADAKGMDYVTIASTGNATDYGDLSSSYGTDSAAASNSHGGIS